MELTVPGEPTAKGRPQFFNGHAVTPKKTLNYETLIKELFIINNPGFKLIQGPLEASIIAYFTIPKSFSKAKTKEALQGQLRPTKKPDADNIAKAILDALNGLAYDDDSHIVRLTVDKFYSDQPRVEVEIKEG